MHERQLEILRAIVEEYVATEEPVGSKAIWQKHALGVSPATIRNDMALLEDAGLITQPHTSAGRIPTNLGYRAFVDKVAQIKPLSTAERRAIESFMATAREVSDIEDLAARTAKMLAQLTHQVAVIQLPDSDRVVVSGTANLARSAHESAADLYPILEALEEQVVLLKLLAGSSPAMNIKIGEEQSNESLQSTSLVSVGYGSSGLGSSGAIGILGRTRMDYSSQMSAVHAVARYIGEFFQEGAR